MFHNREEAAIQLAKCLSPAAEITGRSVVVADDGILTGSTLIAAMQFIKAQHPFELIAAVPVASRKGLHEVRRWCHRDVWLGSPELFRAIDEFYEGFPPVEDAQVAALLHEFAPAT
jgi:predicted phosphoribosyltransferase